MKYEYLGKGMNMGKRIYGATTIVLKGTLAETSREARIQEKMTLIGQQLGLQSRNHPRILYLMYFYKLTTRQKTIETNGLFNAMHGCIGSNNNAKSDYFFTKPLCHKVCS